MTKFNLCCPSFEKHHQNSNYKLLLAAVPKISCKEVAVQCYFSLCTAQKYGLQEPYFCTACLYFPSMHLLFTLHGSSPQALPRPDLVTLATTQPSLNRSAVQLRSRPSKVRGTVRPLSSAAVVQFLPWDACCSSLLFLLVQISAYIQTLAL